ncbi:hypothetical protein [uncultured Bradyrhizobium sp.]|uniref:hypothetical protein n=1 Tax=uncultured Bradyrhizobium sp. TaxID=199684 RepID=UPI0035CC4F3A
MSEQEPERISDNLGDVVGGSTAASTSSDPAAGAPVPGTANDSINVESEKPSPEMVNAEAPKDVSETDAKTEAKSDSPKSPGQILIMPRDQAWHGGGADPASESAGVKPGIFGGRRVGALVAIIALAAAAGAIGGALATTGFGHVAGDRTKVANNRALEDTIARIDTEVAALRTSFEQASKHNASQISKTSDRLDKVEKGQAEPAAKLARLSDTVEKLRTASAAAPAAASAVAPVAAAIPAAPKETTGSVQTANAAPVPLPPPKPEVARLPTVEGWVLRDVSNGSALIEGRQGVFEVYAGDPIPGLGRIDAIRKQDGRWVVVTSRGLIVAR